MTEIMHSTTINNLKKAKGIDTGKHIYETCVIIGIK